MRTLITGSEGFVGSGLHVEGQSLNIDLKNGVDILDPTVGEEIRKFDPEVVFHLAAHHYVPWCDEHPKETHETNAIGTAVLLQACGPSLHTFVLASSAAVYGFGLAPFAEDAVLGGTSVYAQSKLRAEGELRYFAEHHKAVRCVAARLFNIVGVGDPWPHVLPEIVTNRHEKLRLGNTWPLRDYVHVDDVRDALRFLASKAPLGFSAWNVGTGEGTSVRMLVQMVATRAHEVIDTEENDERVRLSDGHLIADVSKTAKLGWTAERSVVRAIDDLLEVSPAVPLTGTPSP